MHKRNGFCRDSQILASKVTVQILKITKKKANIYLTNIKNKTDQTYYINVTNRNLKLFSFKYNRLYK